VIDKIFKVGFYLKAYLWIKPRILGLSILIISILAIAHVHSEYISWVEISGKKIFLGYSYIIKNVLIALLIFFYFIFLKKKEIKSVTQNIAQEPLTDKQEDAFRSLKEKGDLKTEYQRILDGTDEK
jgi:hypothetical protein|tara:strand:- start:47 stop:424 length:378 start_codon:yes stop_codon:yes gene_type:complete